MILFVVWLFVTISSNSIQLVRADQQDENNNAAAAEDQQGQDEVAEDQQQNYNNANGDGNNNYYGNNYNNNGQVDEDQQQQEAEDAAVEEEQEADEDGTVYNTFTVCSDAVIEVKDVKIYCDSPGTFYYGSGKYRNSPSCVPGDKGKITVDFYIAQPDVIQQAGGYVIVDISAQGRGGWYQETQRVFENADLCSLKSLKKKSGSTCPFEGYYRIQTHFYWNQKTSNNYNAQREFYPLVTVGFKSSIRSSAYDYGGANTMYCRGSSFATWTHGISTTYANAIGNFMKTFGILLITIAVMGGFVWFMIHKPTSVKDAGRKMGIVKKDVFLDEDFDFSKIRSPRNEQSLVDF
jgi:hypothetical protein